MLRTVFAVFSFFLLHSSLSIASEINLPRSGQTVSYAAGDDGAVQAGLPSPAPRFTAANGAVTDNLTGLVWLQNANCFGAQPWATALNSVNALATGVCGLSDGSSAGQWHLPTRAELESLIDASKYSPALPTGHPFTAVQANYYWSSSSSAANTSSNAWIVYIYYGSVAAGVKADSYYVWPVRSGI